MNDDITTAVRVLAALGGIALLVWLVQWCMVQSRETRRRRNARHRRRR